MAAVETEAFVTLATNDAYSIGCLTLGRSLRRVRTTRKLVVMVTSGVSPAMRNQLHQVFDVVESVNLLDSQDPINLQLLGRPDLNVTFTKLHCWCLTQFNKCVFLDADTLVLQNVDELFDREELSAAPDAGWPDCFNSGVFVFRPSLETYQSLLDFAVSQGSFDGGDQGLLNSYFSDWATRDISKHLPFIYNVVSQAFYSYLPAFTKFKDSVKIVHFIGAVKPWNHTYNTVTRTVTPLPGTGHSKAFLQLWWTIFMEDIQATLDPQLLTLFGLMNQTDSGAVITGGMGTLQISSAAGGGASVELNDWERKLAWEKGQIDYLGRDSFANIQRKLDATIHAGAAEPVVQASQAPFPRVSPTAETNRTDAGSGKAVSTISISPSSKPQPSINVPQPKAVKTSIKLTSKAAPK
ncbi:glycogenin-1-like isoform X2 [Liolophura sinensis]|uniref:glycogenin-1-like isoform X2 n=1 Tax=Liolophura sinensis TaxID=3198878 RepID=UPI00315914C2